MCRSTNRPNVGEPEIWFRILHVAGDGHNPLFGAPVATYREQAVEIVLGPKGEFENANVGVVTRRVAGERILSAAPRRRRAPKPPKEPRTPRVVQLLQKAIEWQSLLTCGEVANRAEIARRQGITRARVSQVMRLLHLHPEIQSWIRSMPETTSRPRITERTLRPIVGLNDPVDQATRFRDLLAP